MEKLKLETWAGIAKSVGAILCVGGALITSLYKGKEFYIGHHNHHHHANNAVVAHKTHMLRGTFFLLGSCFSYTAWFIAQVCFPFFVVLVYYILHLNLSGLDIFFYI